MRDDDGRCQTCAAGLYTTQTDESFCSPCSSGTFSDDGATQCEPCGSGSYDHDEDPSTACEACPSGRYSSTIGATLCGSECDRGTFSEPGSQDVSACQACEPGQYDHDGDASSVCILCPPNSYTYSNGAVQCTVCAAGLSANGGLAACSETSASWVQTWCPVELADCIAAEGCFESYSSLLASPDRVPVASIELSAVIACVELALASDTTEPTFGCTDTSASNYDAAAIVSDGSCKYDCHAFSRLEDLRDGVECIFQASGELEHIVTITNRTLAIQGSSSQVALGGPTNCYHDFNGQAVDWSTAEAVCVDRGGHLASIHNSPHDDDLLVTQLLPEGSTAW